MVLLTDYRLKSDGKVHPPSIAVVHQDTPVAEIDIIKFQHDTIEFLVHVFEGVMVHLCSLHVAPTGALGIQVVELAPEQRRYSHVKYGYAGMLGDLVVPFAD